MLLINILQHFDFSQNVEFQISLTTVHFTMMQQDA